MDSNWYSVYNSKKDYDEMTHFPKEIKSTAAFEDMPETTEGYEFTISIKDGEEKVKATIEGELINEKEGFTMFRDYLESIFLIHGKDEVKYTYKRIEDVRV